MDTHNRGSVTDSRTASENEADRAGNTNRPALYVDGYDAAFWRESYGMVTEAILKHLGDFVYDDDVAEESIFIATIENVAQQLQASTQALEQVRGALQAVLTMKDTERPRKLDAALSWRENDERAESMAKAAIEMCDTLLTSTRSSVTDQKS